MSLLKKILRRFFGDRNNREVSSNILWTFLIKGGAMIISVLIVPAYAKYFSNDDVYGTWLTISAVFVWLNMFDFGIGNGLRNYLVKTLAAKDDEASKRYISSSYVSVGVISLAFLVIGLIVIAFLDWNAVMRVSETVISPSTFRLFISVMYAGVVIHFFFLLVSSICYALQKTFLPGLVALVTQVLLLLFLLIPSELATEGKVISLSVVYLVAYNLPILIVTLVLFFGRLRTMRPSLRCFDLTAAKQVMSLGGVFFAIQLALIALNSSNEFYITAFFGTDDVVPYTYYHKLFYVLMVFITLVLQPIWSAVTKAYYEKRYGWIKKTYFVINGIGILLSLSGVVLAFLYQPLANVWLGKGVLVVEGFTVALFAIHTAMYIMGNITNSFSNGMGKLKCQTVCTIAGAALKLAIVLVAVNLFENVTWPVVMLANVIALIPMVVVHPIYIYAQIRKCCREGAVGADTPTTEAIDEKK